MAIEQTLKTFAYKVYDEDGTFLSELPDPINEYTHTAELNSGGSTINIELARNTDSKILAFETIDDSDDDPLQDHSGDDVLSSVHSRNQVGGGSDVNYNNRVDVIAFFGSASTLEDHSGSDVLDSGGDAIDTSLFALNGRKIFTGFISDITSRYGDVETTSISVTSFGFDLDQFVIDTVGDGTGDTTVVYNSYDPSDIVTDALDKFAGLGVITYDSSIDTTATTVSYTFRVNTYLEVLKKAVELAPTDWFFWVGLGDNLVRFKGRPDTPDHTFTLGRDILSLELSSTILSVVNDVYVSGGDIGGGVNLYKRYYDAPGLRTRHGLDRMSDNRVTLTDTAEILATSEIDRSNRIQYRSTIEILDDKYEIESIELGHLVAFRNFDNYVDSLTMMVVGLTYEPDKITLQLETLLPKITKRVEDIKRNLAAQENEQNPDSPT